MTVQKAYSVLVNKDNPLSSDFVPRNLVSVESRVKTYIDTNYKLLLENMTLVNFVKLQEAAMGHGFDLEVCSGYRSYDYQERLLNHYLEIEGMNAYKKVALPGCSEHQLGLGLDYLLYRKKRSCEMTSIEIASFENLTAESQYWISRNAHSHGFILRYPYAPSGDPEEVHPETGVKGEPWHLRFVGHSVACEMFDEKKPMVLEEYHRNIKG